MQVVVVLGFVVVIFGVDVDGNFFEVVQLDLTVVLEGSLVVLLILDVEEAGFGVVELFAGLLEVLVAADVLGYAVEGLLVPGVDDLCVDEELVAGSSREVEGSVAIELSSLDSSSSSSSSSVPSLDGSVEFISIEGGVIVELSVPSGSSATGSSSKSMLCHVQLGSVQLYTQAGL